MRYVSGSWKQRLSTQIADVQTQAAGIAFVLVSDDFLARWPYLKDSSVLLSASADSGLGNKNKGSDGLQELFQAG